MGALIAIVFIIALWDVAKSAAKHARSDYGKSRDAAVREAGEKSGGGALPSPQRKTVVRRHATGYWLREALGLFPATRAGWLAGWTAHKTALAEEKARVVDERARHDDAQQSLGDKVREHRRRQEEACKRAQKQEEVPGEGTEVFIDAPLPSETVDQPTRRVDGKPETEDDKRFFDARETGYKGWISRHGYPVPDRNDPDPARSQFPPGPAGNGTNGNGTQPPATEGGHMPTGTSASGDTTYYSVLADAKAAHAQSDEDTASIQKRMDDAYAAADEMAAANVDPAVIDQQMSYADSLKEALQALTSAGEHAAGTAELAEKYHGDMQEAHDNAPGQVADREFHQGA